jgi:pimeloyl-CoA synthetase
MSRATIDEILDRIRQLPEEDRLLFDEMLAQQEDLEWREEADNAQRLAQSQGIDQDAIDRAIHALRHGG